MRRIKTWCAGLAGTTKVWCAGLASKIKEWLTRHYDAMKKTLIRGLIAIAVLVVAGVVYWLCGKWTISQVFERTEAFEPRTREVLVRNCDAIPPMKDTETCSADVSQSLSVGTSFGLNIKVFGGIELGQNVGAGWSTSIGSSQSKELPVPPAGQIYRFSVTMNYTKVTDNVLARSPFGRQHKGQYAYYSSCSVEPKLVEVLNCEGTSIPSLPPTGTPTPTVAASATATASHTATATAAYTATSTPTTTRVVTRAATPTPAPTMTPRPTMTPTPVPSEIPASTKEPTPTPDWVLAPTP